MANGLENLTRTGGNRYADKHALLGVIRAALEGSLTDAEVRRWAGMERDAVVTLAKRKRMASQKAVAVYDAMIAGMISGACEPFVTVEPGPNGTVKRYGGLDFGGILKFGLIEASRLRVWSEDDHGEKLSDRGIVPYQLEVAPGEGTVGPDGIERAWFYMDTPNEEKRVIWKQGKLMKGVSRFKTKVLDLFWLELNRIQY